MLKKIMMSSQNVTLFLLQKIFFLFIFGVMFSIPFSVSANMSLVLNSSRTTGVAPFPVSFDTMGTTDIGVTSLPFHDIQYTWDFGDNAIPSFWAYGTRAGRASKNIAYGPESAHVFERPGTFTVTLTAFDGVATTSTTTVITVTDPDVVFASNTLCVSNTALPVAGADGCPVGASVLQTTSWLDVFSHSGTSKRILLKRGETWHTDGAGQIGAVGPGIFSSYGTGDRPIISIENNTVAFAGAEDWRFVGFEVTTDKAVHGLVVNGDGSLGPGHYICKSDYNQEVGYLPPTYDEAKIAFGLAGNNLILDSYIHDVHGGFGGGNSSGLYVVDTTIEDIFDGNCRSNGAYISDVDNIAILGSYVGRTPGYHGVRLQGTSNTIISNSHFEDAMAIKEVLTIRGKNNPANYAVWGGLWSENIVVSDNVIKAGPLSGTAFEISPQSIGHAERLRNVVVERNFVSTHNGTIAGIFSDTDFLTIRNNIFQTKHSLTIQMSLGGNADVGRPAVTNQFVYNNTFAKIDTTLIPAFSGIYVTNTDMSAVPTPTQHGTGLVVRNNLIYGNGSTMSGAGNGSSPTLMVANTSVLGTDYIESNNSTDLQNKTIRPWDIPTPLIPKDFNPSIGSYVETTPGISVPVWDDFFHTTQGIARYLGAIIPNTLDITPPVTSSVVATPGETTVNITWTTDEGATSQVHISDPSYTQPATIDNTLVTSHSISLFNLIPGTLYHYRVMSQDVEGNIVSSTELTFTTNSLPVVIEQPVISTPPATSMPSSEKKKKKKKSISTKIQKKSGERIAPYITLVTPQVGSYISPHVFKLEVKAEDKSGIQAIMIYENGILKKRKNANTVKHLVKKQKNAILVVKAYDTLGNVKKMTMKIVDKKIVSVRYE